MKKKKIYIIIGVFLIICVLFGILFFKKETTKYYLLISYHYNGASDGKNPDGTLFNSNDILNIDDLSLPLTISPEKTGNLDYMTCVYRVECDKENAETLLDEFAIVYKNNFIETYYKNQNMYEIDETTKKCLNDGDYRQDIETLQTEVNILKRYVKSWNEKIPDMSVENKERLSSILKELENYQNIDLEIFSAKVEQCGITENSEKENLLLNYQINEQEGQYKLNMDSYEIEKEGISLYDEALSSSILIPTYDKKDSFYMSRAKNGIDYLTENAKNYLAWSESAKEESKTLSNIQSKIEISSTIDESDLLNKLQNIRNEIKELDEEIIESESVITIEKKA